MVKRKIFNAKASEAMSFDRFVFDINSRYDLETFEIIRRVLRKDSNCIDVGAHKGAILKEMIKAAPLGKHLAFEPLPDLYEELKLNFNGNNVKVYTYALSDNGGLTSFNYVTTNPAYSGILKRDYDRPEQDRIIQVEVRRLDDIVDLDMPIKLIKIDVEGAEFGVLKGANKLMTRWKPVIIYEQGLGGADIYGTQPGHFFDYMQLFGYKISLMEYYLRDKEPLSREEYCLNFTKGYNYYFIAY